MSTLKRWIDQGLLAAERTPGGHRRIELVEALRFVRSAGLTVVKPWALGQSAVDTDLSAEKSAAHSQLQSLLIQGNPDRIRDHLLGLYAAGQPMAAIGDLVLQPAFAEVGALWRHGEGGIATEHRATESVLRGLAEIGAVIKSAPRSLRAVGGALSLDPYRIPTTLVGLVLAESGFQSHNLGPETPTRVLLADARKFSARLVWASVSVAHDINVRSLTKLARDLEPLGAILVVGGRAAPPRIPGATVLPDFTSLATFVRGLLASRR